MKKLKKDFQKNINRSRDAPKDNSSVDKAKSKLVHSEDYRNKIIKTNEKFKDKIAEKDSKLIQDSNKKLDGVDYKKSTNKVKASKKEKLASTMDKSKLVHSEDYKSKIIKSKERYKDKLKKKNSKLINGEVFASRQNDGLSDNKESTRQQKYKRKNYKDTVYTRDRDKKTKDNENHKYKANKNNKESVNQDAIDQIKDKKLRNYQRKQYHLKNKSSKYGLFYDVQDGILNVGAKTTALARDYLNQGRDNVGVESAEKAANVMSKTQNKVRRHKLNRKKKNFRKLSKLDKKINKRESKLEFKSALTDLKNKEEYQKSNAIKKFFKRRRMKSMIAKKHETRFIDRVKKRFFNLSKKAKEVIIKKVKGFLFIIIIAALLMSGMISLFSLGGTGINSSTSSVLATSYLASPDFLMKQEKGLLELEVKLQDKVDNPEYYYPGFDEYIVKIKGGYDGKIGHNMHEFFSYFTATNGNPEELPPEEWYPSYNVATFRKMYKLKTEKEIETRVDEDGKEYIYKKLYITIEKREIDEIAKDELEKYPDNMAHYFALLETKGNMYNVFGSSNNIDLSKLNNVIGEKKEYEASSEIQKRIADAALVTPSPGIGLCAKWVSQVYENAGLGYIGGNACDMFNNYATITDKSKLQVGMLVMVESSSSGTVSGLKYGHVGIYIGDGKVIDNIGNVRIISLDNWINFYCKNSPVGFGYPPSVQP